MRLPALALAALGLLGIVIGIATMIKGATGPGAISFTHEGYGGPGVLIAGLIALAAGGYLATAGVARR